MKMNVSFQNNVNWDHNMLKCKINSTNGGTFSNFAGKILVRFFLVHRAIIMSK